MSKRHRSLPRFQKCHSRARAEPLGHAMGFSMEGLATYRSISDADYRSLLSTALIVFDTNALLNLYRYHPATRRALLSILEQLKDLLWIPHHAMQEFWSRRESVIEDQASELLETLAGISKRQADLEQLVRTWANRIGLSATRTAGLIKTLKAPISALTEQIQDIGADYPAESTLDTGDDPVIQHLESILTSAVGPPFAADDLRAARLDAYQRIDDRVPPGYRDSRKNENSIGDYLIWYPDASGG